MATQISAKVKRAVCTHCYAHTLNLAVDDSIKKCRVCNDALEIAFKNTKLIRYSPKRNASFDCIKAQEDSGSNVGTRTLCPTRWTVRGASIGSILENYTVLNQLWEECLQKKLLPDIKGRLFGVRIQISQFNFAFGMKLCENILKIIYNLSKTPQKESLSTAHAQHLAEVTVKTLKSMRTDDSFKLFFQHLEILCKHTDTGESSFPRCLDVGDGEGYHCSTVDEHYCQQCHGLDNRGYPRSL